MNDELLYKNYPRVAPTAEFYGFTHDDIKNFMSIIENSQAKEFILHPELNLKALMVRLDCHKEQFDNKITELFFKSLNEVSERVGIRQVPLVYALYYK